MIGHLLSLLLVAAVPQEAPADEQVQAVVQALDEAFKGQDEEAQLDAINAAAECVHAEVIRRVADQVTSKNRSVKAAAIAALGQLNDPQALKTLHAVYEKDKALREDEALFVTLLTAIGRHGDPSSVSLLLDKPFDQLTLATGMARIFGLGNIRSRESVE